MEEPSKIYIGDLRKALIHIGEEEPMKEIRNTNHVTGGTPRGGKEKAEVEEEVKSEVNPEESIYQTT